MKISKKHFLRLLTVVYITTLLMMYMPSELDYKSLVWLCILQLVVNSYAVSTSRKKSASLLLIAFLVFSWFFHCGQLVKLVFDIRGTVPLDFRMYGSEAEILKSFKYYLLSQMSVTIGMLLYDIKINKLTGKQFEDMQIDLKKIAIWLMLIGILPRLFIDYAKLSGAYQEGYRGVYSLVIPQYIASIAFFFDAGVIVALFHFGTGGKGTVLFLGITMYKGLLMVSGSRQEALCFLIIWFYLYYFVLQILDIRKILMLALATFIGLNFINAIGRIRSGDQISLDLVWQAMSSSEGDSMLGDMMGEFGSAFCTLIVAIAYTPSAVAFGLGRSYIAGVFSIIPLLVAQIPALKEAVLFVRQAPASVYFALGGSYIGETYYNFAWMGAIVCAIIGWFVGYCQYHMFEKRYNGGYPIRAIWGAILSTAMLLLIRGYFTDMVQKLVWLWIALSFINRRNVFRRKT